MNEAYADPNHVIESLKQHIEASEQSKLDEGRVTVLDTDCVITAAKRQSLEDRNITETHDMVDDTTCTIQWEVNPFGSPHLTLHFHEKVVENTFELNPAGHRAWDAKQATDPPELSERLGRALADFVEQDAIWTFSEVSAGSMANGGHYTDFEFEYSIDGIEL